jgi:4-amino-4-deoxy-L-arabinose transferase-like glycosyltransferase
MRSLGIVSRILAAVSMGLLLAAIVWSIGRTLMVVTVINDAGLFAELARTLLAADRTLYVDLWDNKPPGLFIFTAPFILIFGNTTTAIQLAGVALAAFFAAGIAVLTHYLSQERLASAVAFILGIFYAMIIIYSRGIETTVLMAALGTWGLYLVIAGRGRVSWLIAGGILFVLAVFSKQPMALEFPLWLVAAWVFSAKEHKFRGLTLVVVGCILGTIIMLGWAYLNGNLLAMGEYLLWGNSRYALGTDNSYTPYWDYVLRETLPIMMPLAVMAAFAFLIIRHDERRRSLFFVIGLWLVTAFAGAALGKALKITYFVQLMPPLIVLVGLGFVKARRCFPAFLTALLIVLPLVLLASPYSYLKGYEGFLKRMYSVTSLEYNVAMFLRENTQPGDCVWLWGYVNSISYYSEVPSCTAVPYEAMVMNSEGFNTTRYRPQYMADLIDNQPAYLVHNSAWGYFPMLEQYAQRYVREQAATPYSIYRIDTSAWYDTHINFANLFTMIGYDRYQAASLCAGNLIRYSMTWQVQQPPTQYYQVFLQVRSAETHETIAGVDTVPLADYPTQDWLQVGEIVLSDTFNLTIPEDTPVGDYYIATGFYDTNTLERLHIVDDNGTTIHSETVLDTLTITSCAE